MHDGGAARVRERARMVGAAMDAFLLLLALDRDGTYVHEEKDVQVGALRGLANVLSGKLARIGRQAAGKREP